MNQKADWYLFFDTAAIQRVYYLSLFHLNIVFSMMLPRCFKDPYKCKHFCGHNILPYFCLLLELLKTAFVFLNELMWIYSTIFLLINSWDASDIDNILFHHVVDWLSVS